VSQADPQGSEIPEGSIAAGRRVRLPSGAEPPFKVFINGVEQAEGKAYVTRGNEILFNRPIVKEQVSGARWLAMFLGLFGSYRKNEIVDVQYQRADGPPQLASDVEILP
jgi:hypothetical protein